MSRPAAGDGLLSGGGGVPVGPCPACEREVVAYLRDADGGGAFHACVHCDGPVRGVELRDEESLAALGYSVADPLASGCGTGCGTGGCGPRPTIEDLLARHRRM